MAENKKPARPRSDAIEADPRFPAFAEKYVELKGNAHRAALAAGYPAAYAKSHAHQLASRLRLKVGPILRSAGIDEVKIAHRLAALMRAREPKWNNHAKRWDKFGNAAVQLGALQVAVKLLDLEPPKRVAGEGPGGAIIVHHSIPQPQREPKVKPPSAGA